MVVDLPRYVFLVKNLRGVLAVEPENAEKYVGWLAKRFRYRDLGVPECLVSAAKHVFEKYLGGKPFHVLTYPTARVAEAATELAESLGSRIGDCIAEAILLASAYAAPIHASEPVIRRLEESGLVVHIVRGPKMDTKNAKLHLRIVDYTVLDMYIDSINEAVLWIRNSCEKGKLHKLRLERALRVEKRYWRLTGKGENIIVAYVDYLGSLEDKCSLLKRLVGAEERVLLAMLAAFNLDAVEA